MGKLILLLSIFIPLAVGCFNLEIGNDSVESLEFEEVDLAASGSSLASFETTLFPIITANCGGCHGVSQAPKFAVSNAQQSHDTLLSFNLVDLTSPASSRLVQKVLAGHQGFSAQLANDIESAIAQWALSAPADNGNTGGTGNGSSGGNTNNGDKGDSVLVYENTLYPKISANCSGCHGVYQNPMFANPNDSVDSHDKLIEYNLVNFTTPSNSAIVQKIAGGHQGFASSVATEFENQIIAWKTQLGEENLPSPPLLEATFSSIHSLILVPKCVGCHSPGGSRSQEDYSNYSSTISTGKITAGDPNDSEMYKECVDGDMPFQADDLTSEELDAIRDWILDGAQDN